MPTGPDKSHDRRLLADWLGEWRLDCLLREVPPPGPALPDACATPLPIAGPRARLRPGDIRLLAPTPVVTPQGVRPTYVLILDPLPDSGWRVIPFGRFASPAVPGEWRTGLRALPLRVLCLWNSRDVGTPALGRSWRAGRVSAHWLARARQRHAQRVAHDGSSTPGGPCLTREPDLGPPLLHPLDPRWQYLQEEADTMEEALGDGGAPAGNGAHQPAAYPLADESLLKAAEDGPTYDGED